MHGRFNQSPLHAWRNGRLLSPPYPPKRTNSVSLVARQCKIKSEGLCEEAFNSTIVRGESEPFIAQSTGLVLWVFIILFTFGYALVLERLHRIRVKQRHRKAMEDSSYSAKHSEGKNLKGKIATDTQVRLRGNSTIRENIKDQQFFEMINSKDASKQSGSIIWWDINFEEQEMEDMYRKVSFGREKSEKLRSFHFC